MSSIRLAGAPRLVLLVVFCLLTSTSAAAQGWTSPLLGRELVIVEKTVSGDPSPAGPLPSAVQEKLGPDFVEYETFVAARLPAAEAEELAEKAVLEDRAVLEDPDLPVVLPFHTFRAENPEERSAPWAGHQLQPKEVPKLFLIRFAFPLLPEWSNELRACGADPILYYGNGVFLIRAGNLEVIKSCESAARYLDWVDAFLTTDRISPALLDGAGLDFAPYSLTFAPGTDLETALAELPAVVAVGDHMIWEDGTLSLGVMAGAPELEDLVRTSLHLLSIQEASAEPEPSDERQGQIVAGNYNGYPGAVSGAVTSPGYLTWLANRDLRSASNQQTVAVFDTGYDDGSGVTGAHHPDLETPERLVDVGNFIISPTTPATEDHRGHGTMVAGIITGNGTRSGTRDAQGFYLGTGIAPDAKLVAVQIMDNRTNCDPKDIFFYPPTQLGNAISFGRIGPGGGAKALIGNHSWNVFILGYDLIARLFDERTIDADNLTSNGRQAMTMIVAAGNNGTGGANTILSPATAKNVITVGATQNYRPSTEGGAPPNECDNSNIPPSFTQEANNIATVGAFSSKGVEFAPSGQGKPLAHSVRIKPDLVAPGGRVFSTVPYQSDSSYSCYNLCRRNWPSGDSHSYSSGTSFSAPVVSGAAALLSKWFLDRGATPSPSLLKAALIATATDLGPPSGGDHRPSYRFGWGRVDLNRLTDPSVVRFYAAENANPALSTGQEKQWTRTIDNPAKPVFITLAWSDPPSPSSNGYPPLINDLRLSVELVGSNSAWHGNNFGENIAGNDSGFSHRYAKSAPSKVDSMNTMESVFIPANTFSAGARIVLRVKGTNVRTNGGQRFAIYAYNVRLNS